MTSKRRRGSLAGNLPELDLPERVRGVLAGHGIREADQLASLTARELAQLSGIGAKSVASIERALAEVGRQLAFDPLGPYECARHRAQAWDAALRSYWLCDACASEFSTKAFSGAAPLYVGPSVTGYCCHCNTRCETIRMRQWFLCGTCDRVVRSIGRSIAADGFFSMWWEQHAAPRLQGVELSLTDPPELRPYSHGRGQTQVARVDFTCTRSASGASVFGVELKTGRGHICGTGIGSRIQQFQLDHSDCDDILSVVRAERIPIYLVHAQVIDRADPPTTHLVGVGLWWTDMFSMKSHKRSSRNRPRETRMAAYYDTSMFHDMSSLVEHLESGGAVELGKRLDAEGVPELY